MVYNNYKRIAVIGADISGTAAANVLKKNGYEAVVFEKSTEIGGARLVVADIEAQALEKEQQRLRDFGAVVLLFKLLQLRFKGFSIQPYRCS